MKRKKDRVGIHHCINLTISSRLEYKITFYYLKSLFSSYYLFV